MDFKACLDDQIGRLVHPAALASPRETLRHRTFVATRLAVAFAALAVVPAYLVTGGVPGAAEAMVLACLVAPLLAVVHVSRTGALVQGEMLSLAAWVGLASTLVFGHLCSTGPAVALLFMVPLEAALGSRRAGRATAGALAVGGLLIAAARWSGLGGASAPADAVIYAAALLYGGTLAWCGACLHNEPEDTDAGESLPFKTLAEALGDFVIRFDRSGTVLDAGLSPGPLLGLKPGDLAGRGFFDRVHVADRPNFLKLVSDTAAGDVSRTGSIRLRAATTAVADTGFAEPSFAWVEIRARGLAAVPAGTEPAVLAVIRDITTRVDHEAAIERAARDAETASAWKDRFLATVTHELRTPLNAIIGFGEILASEAHAPQDVKRQREYAEIIHTSGLHLLSVVNSLLDMSKIEAGMLEIDYEPLDVGAIVGACCDMMRLKAEQSRIDLVRDLAPGLPALLGDKRACKQIVINLLSNALKFTPEYGCVTISARLEGDMLAIAVADTGIGMVAPDMARLGDPFFQAQNSYDRRYEGTGLGLSVVSGLVGLHGGTIAAESAPGEGTCMTVRLPRDGREQPPQTAKAKIQILPRQPRQPQAVHLPKKVQKIA